MYEKYYYVYILANISRTVLYVGITSNLIKRVWQHKNAVVEGFTQRYKVHDLLYFESHNDVNEAIKREKLIKKWNRSKKETLILKFNPSQEDLYSQIV